MIRTPVSPWAIPRIRFLGWLNLYLWLRWAAPYITLFDGSSIGIIVATVIFMVLQLALVYEIAQLRLSVSRRLLIFVTFTFLFIVMARLKAGIFADISLIFAASFLGCLVAGGIREPNLLLPIAIVAALVDYWGVHFGPTQALLSKAPQILHTMSAKIPTLGKAAQAPGGLPYIAMIGPGDFLFLGIFYTCVHKFGMKGRLTFILTAILLTLGMLMALLTPVAYIPALVPMGLAVIGANWRYLKFKREELFALLYAGIFIAILIWLFIIYLDRTKPKEYNRRGVKSSKNSGVRNRKDLPIPGIGALLAPFIS